MLATRLRRRQRHRESRAMGTETQVRRRLGRLPVLALVRLVLALVALAGLGLAAFAILTSLAVPLGGSVCSLGVLAPGGIVASCSRTSRPGCRCGVAAWWARGQRRSVSWCRHRPAGPGVLHGHAEGNPEERTQHRADTDQQLAATTKRSAPGASDAEHGFYLAEAPCAQTCRSEAYPAPYRARGRDQGVSGLGWSWPSTQMSARSL